MAYTVLNTRPVHQAHALSSLIHDSGGHSIECPTIEIHWLPEALDKIAFNGVFDKVIFISANAVTGFAEQEQSEVVQRIMSQSQCYAIGKATRAKAKQLGFDLQVLSEQQFDSEHFLAHSSMQEISNQNILLVKGLEGRNLIEDTLQARGANVVALEVYQRRATQFCVKSWQVFLKASQPVLLLTSLDSWHKLLAGLYAQHNPGQTFANQSEDKQVAFLQSNFWAQVAGAVVMSQRIADAIKAEGWQRPLVVVKSQENSGIIEAIQRFCSQQNK